MIFSSLGQPQRTVAPKLARFDSVESLPWKIFSHCNRYGSREASIPISYSGNPNSKPVVQFCGKRHAERHGVMC